jgi:phage tail-like protein
MADKATPGVGAIVDPYRNYNFRLSIPGVGEGRFTRCSGLNVQSERISYREAGANQIIRYMSGPLVFDPVSLWHGVTQSADIWIWLKKVMDGDDARCSITISTLDLKGLAGPSWVLTNAWPCHWSGVAFDTLGREAAIEELRLSYDGIDRISGERPTAQAK